MNNSVIVIKEKNKENNIIEVYQIAHGLSVGNVVYFSQTVDTTYGRYEKANASVIEKANAIGLVYEVVNADSFKIITNGLFKNALLFKNYAIGKIIYLDSTDGSFTDVEQTYSKILGVRVLNGLLVNIQRGYINYSVIKGQTTDSNGFIDTAKDIVSAQTDNSLKALNDGLYVGGVSNSYRKITQINHGLSIGDTVYYSTDGYKKAIAADSDEVEVVGIVSNIISADEFELIMSGYLETTIFDSYSNGTVLFLSDTTSGSLTGTEPSISKPIAVKVNSGIIINIQRGSINDNTNSDVLVNIDDKIGDFKYSYDTTQIRTDGYILFKENISYDKTKMKELLDTLSNDFITKYIVIADTTFSFQNTSEIINTINYQSATPGANLYIKAFSSGLAEIHTHANKDVLDKLSVSDGTLLYDGKAISGGSIGTGSTVYQKTELNVTQNQIIHVTPESSYSSEKAIVQVYKIQAGTQNVVQVIKTFDNTEESSFYYDSDKVEFNGVMKIKDTYALAETVNSDGYYESDVIDKSQFTVLDSIKIS